jgi:hypothetical protein
MKLGMGNLSPGLQWIVQAGIWDALSWREMSKEPPGHADDRNCRQLMLFRGSAAVEVRCIYFRRRRGVTHARNKRWQEQSSFQEFQHNIGMSKEDL